MPDRAGHQGTLTFPVALVWMGWPTLTLREVCDESTPQYRRIGYRDLVKFRDERIARQAAAKAAGQQSLTNPK